MPFREKLKPRVVKELVLGHTAPQWVIIDPSPGLPNSTLRGHICHMVLQPLF